MIDRNAEHADPGKLPNGDSTEGDSHAGQTDIFDTIRSLGRYLWREANDLHSPTWPPRWLVAIGAAAAIVFLACIVAPIIRGIVNAVGAAGFWLNDWAVTDVVTVPVRSYLDDHAVALPVPGTTLWAIWCIVGALLFALSVARSFGARIGWAICGAATAGMALVATQAGRGGVVLPGGRSGTTCWTPTRWTASTR